MNNRAIFATIKESKRKHKQKQKNKNESKTKQKKKQMIIAINRPNDL